MDYETITELHRVHQTREVGETNRVPLGKGRNYFTFMRLHIFKVPEIYIIPSIFVEVDGLKGDRIIWLSVGFLNFTLSLQITKR
jgi:hypothetical protein